MSREADLSAFIGMMILNRLYDAGGSMDYQALRLSLADYHHRRVFAALVDQHNLGNTRRWREGERVELTASARAAIAAGRLYGELPR